MLIFVFFFFFISAKYEEKFENWTKEKERMDARIDCVEPLRVVWRRLRKGIE